MTYRVLAAMALACVMALPAHASMKGRAIASEARLITADNGQKAKRPEIQDRRKLAGNAVEIARRYLGTNPTGLGRAWCQNFLNMVERKAGRAGTGSNLARSALGYGRRVTLAQVQPGDILIFARGKGGKYGHSAYFMGWKRGKLEAISGNSRGGVVAIGSYDPARLLGVRRPV